MPRKPAIPARQKGRRYKLHTVTLDPETIERCERIQAAIPQLDGLSAALRYAAMVADERIAAKLEANKQEKHQ